MAERAEDFDYKNGGEGSPQAARAAFGEPLPWMQWESSDHTHSDGAYGGFHFQDKDKPFILHGGGFSDDAKYIGTYVSICPGGMPVIGDDYILKNTSNLENLISFGVFPDHINLIKKTTHEKIECKLYPTDWPDALVPSEEIKTQEFFRNYQEIMRKLNKTADKIGHKVISENGNDDHLLARITYKSHSEVRISVTLYGKRSDFKEFPQNTWNIGFSIPDEIKPYYDEIETSQLSLLTSPAWSRTGDGYIILKNGLYLTRDP